MEIKNFKTVNKGYIVGRFDLHIDEWGGLVIKDCTLFKKNETKWIAPPQKSFEAEGKKMYSPLVSFRKEIFDKLQKKAIELIDIHLSSSSKEIEPEQLELPF